MPDPFPQIRGQTLFFEKTKILRFLKPWQTKRGGHCIPAGGAAFSADLSAPDGESGGRRTAKRASALLDYPTRGLAPRPLRGGSPPHPRSYIGYVDNVFFVSGYPFGPLGRYAGDSVGKPPRRVRNFRVLGFRVPAFPHVPRYVEEADAICLLPSGDRGPRVGVSVTVG